MPTKRKTLAQIKAEEKINDDALAENKRTWSRQYAGKWVAIHQGDVITARATLKGLEWWIDSLERQGNQRKIKGDILIHQFPIPRRKKGNPKKKEVK